MADLIQIKIKRSDYDRLVKFGVAGEPVHEAQTRALDKAECEKEEEARKEVA